MNLVDVDEVDDDEEDEEEDDGREWDATDDDDDGPLRGLDCDSEVIRLLRPRNWTLRAQKVLVLELRELAKMWWLQSGRERVSE